MFTDFILIVMASLTSDSATMKSAGIFALARIVYEFGVRARPPCAIPLPH